MMKLISEIIKEPEKMPNWLKEGVIYRIPKKKKNVKKKKSKKLLTNHIPSNMRQNNIIDS